MSKLEERQKLGPPQIGRRLAERARVITDDTVIAGSLPKSIVAVEGPHVGVVFGDILAASPAEARSEKIAELRNAVDNIGTPPNKGTRGRPKSALSKAERQKAYRAKKAGRA